MKMKAIPNKSFEWHELAKMIADGWSITKKKYDECAKNLIENDTDLLQENGKIYTIGTSTIGKDKRTTTYTLYELKEEILK